MSMNQRGFTIIELLIATMVFSTIFLGSTTALVQIGKLYYKGVVTGRTQEVSRGVIDQVSQQLQFSDATLMISPPLGYNVEEFDGRMSFQAYCIGATRYTYRLNVKVDSRVDNNHYDNSNNGLKHGLWRDKVDGTDCRPVDLSQTQPSENGQELLAQSMRLSAFDINCNVRGICNISVGVMYGNNDMMTPDPATAVPTRCQTVVGSQWCAASQFKTSVVKRVGNQ